MGNCLFLAIPYARDTTYGNSNDQITRSLFDDIKRNSVFLSTVSPPNRQIIHSLSHDDKEPEHQIDTN